MLKSIWRKNFSLLLSSLTFSLIGVVHPLRLLMFQPYLNFCKTKNTRCINKWFYFPKKCVILKLKMNLKTTTNFSLSYRELYLSLIMTLHPLWLMMSQPCLNFCKTKNTMSITKWFYLKKCDIFKLKMNLKTTNNFSLSYLRFNSFTN